MTAELSSDLLKTALHDGSQSGGGILSKIFSVWFDAFVYNQIWEDPKVDLEALRLDAESRVLTISSGGCNVLNYLLSGPASVTAVDLNRHHIALLKLKLASALTLPDHDSFFTFFGRGLGSRTTKDFEEYIAPALDPETLEYWTAPSGIRRRPRITMFTSPGLYNESRNALFLRFFQRFARISGCDVAAVLEADSIADQERIFEEQILPFFRSRPVRFIGRMPLTMFGLGIPPRQFEELKRDLREGQGLLDVYEERVRKLATGFPIRENYFAWQAFARRYDTDRMGAVPEYLKPESFEALREFASRAKAKVASVTGEIANAPNNTFNRFVFLDAQDWMERESLIGLWTLIAERAERGSRIIFRTAGSKSPLAKALPADLLARFRYEKNESARLQLLDRSAIYGGFHLYVLN